MRTDFERRDTPSAPYVRYLVKKTARNWLLIHRPKTMHTPENIAAVAESVCEAPLTSIHNTAAYNR